MSTNSSPHASECAARLRTLAAMLGTQSMGTQWRSPAKDHAEAQLWEIENEARVVARKLELWAETEGSRSLLAELL